MSGIMVYDRENIEKTLFSFYNGEEALLCKIGSTGVNGFLHVLIIVYVGSRAKGARIKEDNYAGNYWCNG